MAALDEYIPNKKKEIPEGISFLNSINIEVLLTWSHQRLLPAFLLQPSQSGRHSTS